MSHLIKNNPYIKGVKMGSEVEHVIYNLQMILLSF